MVIRSEVHSWLWAMEGTCCLSRPMYENQSEKKLAKQLLFVCLSELPSKRNRCERANDRYWHEAADQVGVRFQPDIEPTSPNDRVCSTGLKEHSRDLPTGLSQRLGDGNVVSSLLAWMAPTGGSHGKPYRTKKILSQAARRG